MLIIRVALLGACAAAMWAQSALTAEQVLEKSIAASGGRKALEKITSTVGKGTLDVPSQGVTAALEYYAKAPDKRLIVVKVEGWGELRRSCDGRTAWEDHPSNGFRALEGEERADALGECVFNEELKWRELYPKIEGAGKEKVGEREAYKIVMTPATGKPVTRYFDADTFLLAGQAMKRSTPQGIVEVRVEYSDYREVDGIKIPFGVKELTPGQEVIIRLTELQNNVAIEDARFAKPAGK
jgi:hypothetical protein